MTFEEFKASRRETADIETATEGAYPTEGTRAGFIYADGYVIERAATGYALYIENQEYLSDDIESLERELFDYFKGEWCDDETAEPVAPAAAEPVAPAAAEPVAPTIADKIKLARAFGERLQEELSTGQFRAMCDANKGEPEDSGVCHSHDYCDANMVMHDAFAETFGREPAFLSDSEDSADLELWNDAWAIAKAADFFA